MDTRQLKTLVAIHAHGTFAQAADVVALTPSAVSQQIHALEEELGVTLFDRSSRPPKITPEGMQVLDMARDVLHRVDETRASLRGDLFAGSLMLGSVRSSAMHLLPDAIVHMRARHPKLTVNLRVAMSTALIADVAAGRLDAAVVAEHTGFPTALRWSPFLREPLWLIAPPGTPRQDPATLLNTMPYVRFQSSVPLAHMIETELSRLGVVTQDVATVDNVGTIITWVRQGLGISVAPHGMLVDPLDSGIVRIPFGVPQLTRQIGLVERAVSARRALIHEMHEVLAELAGDHGVAPA